MTEHLQSSGGRGPSHRSFEISIAVATMLFGLLIVYGSIKAGIDWGIEGPRAGFFPFYIGLLIVLGSLFTILQIMLLPRDGRQFADWEQLRRVLWVLAPAAIYVALVPTIGIYVASALLILVFMRWIGYYGMGMALLLALGLPLITFVTFERLFLIPLPKGPLENFLGF